MSQVRRLSLWWGMAVAGVVLAIALSGGAHAAGGPPPTGTPQCTGAQLQLKYLDSQGAAGRRYWDFAFKNTGSTCTVRGYARITLFGKHGHSVGAHVTHQPGITPMTVIVGHGKRAFFTFVYADGGFCTGVATLHVYGFKLFGPRGTHGTKFNPLPPSHGLVPWVCKGSEHMYPLRATRSLGAAGLASSTPVCSTSRLRLETAGGQGFTSHRELDFALRNVGPATCHLKGFPGIGLLDAHANLLSTSVTRNGGSQPAVVLHTWHRAFFRFVYTVAAPCLPHFYSFYGLQVIAPAATQGLRWYAGGRVEVCGSSHPTVSAVVSHL